jgi:hypothetical protein
VGAAVGAGAGCGADATGAGLAGAGAGAGVDFGVARCCGVIVARRLVTTRWVAWRRGAARTGAAALVFLSAFTPDLGFGVALATSVPGAEAARRVRPDRRVGRFAATRLTLAFGFGWTLTGAFPLSLGMEAGGLAPSPATAAATELSDAASFGFEVPRPAVYVTIRPTTSPAARAMAPIFSLS